MKIKQDYIINPRELIPNEEEFLIHPASLLGFKDYILDPEEFIPKKEESISRTYLWKRGMGERYIEKTVINGVTANIQSKNKSIIILTMVTLITIISLLFVVLIKKINNFNMNSSHYKDVSLIMDKFMYENDYNGGMFFSNDLDFDKYYISNDRLELDPKELKFTTKKIDLNETGNKELENNVTLKILEGDEINNLTKFDMYILNYYHNFEEILKNSNAIKIPFNKEIIEGSYFVFDSKNHELNIIPSGRLRSELIGILKLYKKENQEYNIKWYEIVNSISDVKRDVDDLILKSIDKNDSLKYYEMKIRTLAWLDEFKVDYKVNILNPYNHSKTLGTIYGGNLLYDFTDSNQKYIVEEIGLVKGNGTPKIEYNKGLTEFFDLVYTSEGNDAIKSLIENDEIRTAREGLFSKGMKIIESNESIKAFEYVGANYYLSFDDNESLGDDIVRIDYIEDYETHIYTAERYTVNVKTKKIFIYDINEDLWIEIEEYFTDIGEPPEVLKGLIDSRYPYYISTTARGVQEITVEQATVYDKPSTDGVAYGYLSKGDIVVSLNEYVDLDTKIFWSNIGGDKWIELTAFGFEDFWADVHRLHDDSWIDTYKPYLDSYLKIYKNLDLNIISFNAKADGYYIDERYEYNEESDFIGDYVVKSGSYYIYKEPDIDSEILDELVEADEFTIFNDFIDEEGNIWGNIGGYAWILLEE